jgi:hypothetical protein
VGHISDLMTTTLLEKKWIGMQVLSLNHGKLQALNGLRSLWQKSTKVKNLILIKNENQSTVEFKMRYIIICKLWDAHYSYQ